MIAVTFALPQESKDFLATLLHPAPAHGGVVGKLGTADIVVAHIGVGQPAAAAKVRALLAVHRPAWLVCAGFAGGLGPDLEAGDLLVATNVSAPELVAKCRQLPSADARLFFGALTTQPEAIETPEAKRQLAHETAARAVDMETSAVAAECTQAGVPLLSVRVISDSADTSLPVPMAHWFNLERQRPRPVALLAYLTRHPRQILPFARFVASLSPTRRVLTDFLITLLKDEGSRPSSRS